MSNPNISEAEVDTLVLALLQKHSESVTVNAEDFLDLLKHSLSLNTMEK
jgi:hypothetical protein